MITLDENTRAGRQLSAGQVTVTFTSPKTGEHITIRAKALAKDENNKWKPANPAEALFISFDVPNDTGFGDKVAKITRRAGFVADPQADKARVFCAQQLLRFVAGQPLATGLVAQEAERCGKCGRQLTDPVSIERGIGPECFGGSTGSTHQTKTRPNPPAPAAPAAEKPLVSAEKQERDAATEALYQAEEALQDEQRGAYPAEEPVRRTRRASERGAGLGWREKKNYVAQMREDATEPETKRTKKGKDKPCSQMSTLPGTTFEDIFRASAARMGVEL